jgi:hypothetical protein
LPINFAFANTVLKERHLPALCYKGSDCTIKVTSFGIQWLRLAVYNGANWAETFILDDRRRSTFWHSVFEKPKMMDQYQKYDHVCHQKSLDFTYFIYMSWDRSVSIVTRIWTGWSTVQFLAWWRDFPLLLNTQTGSEAHPASYSMGNRGPSPEVK